MKRHSRMNRVQRTNPEHSERQAQRKKHNSRVRHQHSEKHPGENHNSRVRHPPRCVQDGSCCAGATDAERRQSVIDKASKAITSIILRRRPSKMASNKWNKMLPSLDFWNQGMAAFGMLADVFDDAIEQL